MLKQGIPTPLTKLFLFIVLFASQNAFALINTPNQNAPNDNDTGTVTSPYFYITGISSLADEIIIEYSESITMSSPTQIARERLSTGAFIYASKLKLGTDYFWRVRLKSSTDSSNWSSIRKFTTTAIFRTTQPSNNVDELRASYVLFGANKVFGFDTILWEIDTTTSFNSTLWRSVAVPDTGISHIVYNKQENFYYGQKYYWRARAYSGANTSGWTPTLYFITGDTIGLKYPSSAWKQHVEVEVEWSTWRDDEPVQIQLDVSPSFSSPVFDTFLPNGIREYPSPRYMLTHLDYETQYYFRARSYNTVDTTQWSSSSFITRGLATDVVIAENYADPNVRLENRTEIDGSEGYQILLDTTENFNSDQLRSFSNVEGVDTAENLFFGEIYYTKARPYHSKDTGEWTRTRAINILIYPSTYYPYRNWTDIGIYDSMQFQSRWGIDGYQVQVTAGTNYDTTLFLDTTLTGLPIKSSQNFIKGLKFKYSTTYEWRIRGWHSLDTSDWSDSKKFTTVTSPKLTRPFNSDFLGDQAELDLQWESMGNNTRYQVMLDTNSQFTSPLLLNTEVDTNALTQKDLLFRPLYYWRVRAVTLDDTSAWSETWKFTVLHARLNSPSNNRTNISVDISSLNWNSITGTDGYILQLDSFSDFRAPEVFSDTVKKSFFHYFSDKPDIITYKTKYYWRVKLYHAMDTTEWSDVWNFTTLPRRSPVLLTPVDSTTDAPVIATLKWNAYSGASSYAIEYAENPQFTSATKATSNTTNIKVVLKPSTRYYWRARGRNSNGDEFYDWSEEWTFVTDKGIPAVTLISPLNEVVDQPRDVVLRWNKNSDATSYRVELSQDEDFLGVFRNTTTVAATNYSDLSNGITYYWRVKTLSNSLTSPWSDVWSFTIEEKPNSVNQLLGDKISVYPNPSSDFILISGVADVSVNIEIVNSLGQIIDAPILKDQRLGFDVRNLESGAYIVNISIGESLVRKAIIITN
jgi:hypothetical protein